MPAARPKLDWKWSVAIVVIAVLVVFTLFQEGIGDVVHDFPYPKVIGLGLLFFACLFFAGGVALVIKSPQEKFASRWLFIFVISAILLMFMAWWTSSQTSPPFTILP